jgi:diguanylate cyclase (GGDEF)-like protein
MNRHWWSRPTEPHILFPAIAVLALALVWGMTLNLVRIERAAAARGAITSTRELAETYEAQVVRVLREIDNALKFVKYGSRFRGPQAVLDELTTQALLPSGRLYVVSITNSKGIVVASTRKAALGTVLDPEDLAVQNYADVLQVGRPRSNSSGEWRVQFARGMLTVDGTPAGIAVISVNADHFVAGYEASKLGANGLIAVVGTHGVLARRSGDSVSFGDRVDVAELMPDHSSQDEVVQLTTMPWDNVPRYTIVRQLYDFPVSFIVGLSEEEQLASARASMRSYLWRASGGSLLLVLFLGALGRTSRQLALSRQAALEAQIANATRVEHLAYHDSLTGLANRSLFSNLLSQSIKLARRHDRRLAVLFLDLDRFKQINDTMGHEAGDHLLKEVAARLKACLRESDTVARLGGDEFVALLPELGEPDYVSVVARKILASVARPVELREHEFSVTASIGIAVFPEDGLDEEALKKSADLAMYRAKEEGKNNFQFYSEKLNAGSLARLTLESGLRHALERGEFELHYQAKREMLSGEVTGLEALLRWRHPDLGIVAPMQFIPLAEETGLIVAIGKWVLRTACLQSVAWSGRGHAGLSMAVNLTSRQFTHENLLADVAQILAETRMDPHLLELEITEGMLMHDVPKAMAILTALKAMGVRIAIDNFGVGYSSLARLKQFALDTIKIDRSFIREMASVAESKDVAAAIIAMGRTLSLTVVALGVETKEQADFLRASACDEFQGFYMDKPASAGQIEELLRQPRKPGYGADTILSVASTSAAST